MNMRSTIVSLLRLSDISEDENEKNECLKRSRGICSDINEKHPQYLKTRINLADTIARQIRLILNISNAKDDEIGRIIFKYRIVDVAQDKKEQIEKDLKEAKESLQQAKIIDITFPNSYFKMVEILILELCFSLPYLSNQDLDKLKEELEENLREAKDKTAEKAKIYIYEYSYLNLMQEHYNSKQKNKNSKQKNKNAKTEENNPQNKQLYDLKTRKDQVVQSIKNNK